jgi:tetratricopeptide (TPR) repeat protein
LAHVYLEEYWAGFNARPELYDPRQRSLAAAQRAVTLEPTSQLAHWALAYSHFYLRDVRAFLSEADVAIALNPNNASVISHLGLFILYVGQWDRGLKLIDKAVQLNPQHPPWYNWGYHNYYYHNRDYERALKAALQIGIPDVFWTPLCLAEVYGQLGRESEARTAAARIAVLYPGFNLRIAREEMEKFNFPADHIQHRLDGLRKAGVQE